MYRDVLYFKKYITKMLAICQTLQLRVKQKDKDYATVHTADTYKRGPAIHTERPHKRQRPGPAGQATGRGNQGAFR